MVVIPVNANKEPADVAVLRLARRLIADPSGWVQGTAAIDPGGNAVTFDNSSACAWCVSAAVARAALQLGAGFAAEWSANAALEAAASLLWDVALPQDVNDMRPADQAHAAVLELLDAAVGLTDSQLRTRPRPAAGVRPGVGVAS